MQEKQTILIVPFLEVEVLALLDKDGVPHVPAASLSRLLSLDHSWEMRRVRHIMLHYQMRYLLTQQPPQRWVWTFPYPLGLTYWLSTVYKRVKDPAWRTKLDPFIEWGIALGGKAFEQVQNQFVQTRTSMYKLASTINDIDQQMHHLRGMTPHWISEQQARFHYLDGGWRHLSEQARTFIQRWLAEKNALPVVNTIAIKDGNVDPDSPPMTLLAFASEEDIATLNGYARAVTEWMHALRALLDDLQT